MDNFSIDITCEGNTRLASALGIVFFDRVTATHYKSEPATKETPARLVLLSYLSGGASELPFTLTTRNAPAFVMGWLAEQDMPPEPDVDGSVVRGWRVWCDPWGKIEHLEGAFLAVSPVWALYGSKP